MQKRALSVFLLLLSSLIFAQPTTQWAKCFGGKGVDIGKTILQTDDGGYLIAGSSNSLDGDIAHLHDSLGVNYDIVLLKTDANGQLQWQKCIGGTQDDMASAMIKTFDGGYAIGGYSWSKDGDNIGNVNYYSADYWLVKIDSMGSIQWQKTFGGYLDDKMYGLAQTRDSGFIMIGTTYSHDGDVSGYHAKTDIWVVKIDTSRTIQWERCYGGSGDEFSGSIVQAQDGGYVFAGYTNSSDSDVVGLHTDYLGENTYDYWVVNLDTLGNIKWSKCFGGDQHDYASQVIKTKDDGYAVIGYSDFGVTLAGYLSYNDYWLIKLDTSGAVQWQKSYGGSNFDEANCIIQTNDNGYLVSGTSLSNDHEVNGNHGRYDYWVVKADGSGNFEWQESFGGSRNDFPYSVIQTIDNGYAISGITYSYDGQIAGYHDSCTYDLSLSDSICTPDIWVIKLNPYEWRGNAMDTIKLSVYIYPNPFDIESTLKFRLDSIPTNSSLHIYNAIGQELKSVSINNKSNTMKIFREALPKGFYICKLEHEGVILAAGKFVVE